MLEFDCLPNGLDDLLVTVTGPQGVAEGSLEWVEPYVAWRAAAPLEPGVYEMEVEFTVTDWCAAPATLSFEVGAPVAPAPVEVTCELQLVTANGPGSETACCRDPDNPDPTGELCFPVTVNTNRLGLAHTTCTTNVEPGRLSQVLVRVIEFPPVDPPDSLILILPTAGPNAPFRSMDATTFDATPNAGVHALDDTLDEWCVTLEISDLQTGQSVTDRYCIPNPRPEPSEEPRSEYTTYDLGVNQGCVIPPSEMVEEWCSINEYYAIAYCDDAAATGAEHAENCSFYGEGVGRRRRYSRSGWGLPSIFSSTSRTPPSRSTNARRSDHL